MLVYGDLAREVGTAEALHRLSTRLQRISKMRAGIERHAELVARFIEMGELAQGIADAEFDACGVDTRSPAQDAAMTVLRILADHVHASWKSQFTELLSLPANLLDELAHIGLPERVTLKHPEGYAFYALYPESYLVAAGALPKDQPVQVIGIRSIGTGLAALVASSLGAPNPVTVRPTGDPFHRQIKLSDEVATELLRDSSARFGIVDEGPGLSGSSFGAVADWLEARGVAPNRIHFLPSHANEPGPMMHARHRERWRMRPRHVVDFDDLVLRAKTPRHRLESWVADLTGPSQQSLDDISGGAWRSRFFPDETMWPPCHVQQERRKFLLHAGGTTWLLKFAGLGKRGAEKLALAQKLNAAGYTPEPAGYRHGFLVERWIQGARALPLCHVDRATLVQRLGSYIGFRAGAFPARPEAGASLATLLQMARRNASLALGEHAAKRLDPWRDKLALLETQVRRVRTDNRLHAWEWLRLPDGRLIKTDGVDHHAAHDLVGCQDPAWDLAGAKIEFDLTSDEVAELCAVFARMTSWAVNPDLLLFYEPCYAAFQLGHWSLAAHSLVGFAAEVLRTRAAADRYIGKLKSVLQRV